MTDRDADDGPDALADLTSVTRADVYKQGEIAAHLTRTPGGVEFRYTDAWVEAGGAPVATTLPVTDVPTLSPGGAVPAYFAGLLPEGRRLGALRRSVKTSADDELSLVLAVGSDAIGDVQVVPSGEAPQQMSARLEVEDFTGVRFRDLLADLHIHVDRVGLPGVQDKVSLAMLNLPVAAAGHKYLLKLNPPEYPHLVENEAFFLLAARGSGIRTVDADLVHDAEGVSGLVVRRYDRVHVEGREHLLAAEDGCQVLGLHPEAKYRLTTEEVLGRLSGLCEAPLPAAREFLAQAVFAYVSCNGDAHAKNFSILQELSGRWAPAPAYDLPTSQPYGDHTLALSVTGKRDGNITGSRYVALGVELGLPERAARRVVAEVARQVDGWVDRLDELPFDQGRVRKLRQVVRRRQRLLADHL
ncbi:type II toxin-antitoxin system HipA family toxin [Nocardioides pakistanensis]